MVSLIRSLVAVTAAAAVSCVAAIDYIGGWVPTSGKTQCVNICVNSKATPGCFDPNDTSCTSKTQSPGDFDYLLLEQLFVPQFCRDLLKGVDTTVSHQNVNPYPAGVTCKSEVVRPELTIHGLWPNYNNGYPGCCNVSATIPNKPYNAAKFASNHPTLLKQMAKKWIDPTQSTSYDTLCEIYNHEFQKHGLCFAAYGNDYPRAAVNYFEATLNIATKLDTATAKINSWAKLATPQTTVAEIKALYSKSVQVLCSAAEGGNQLGAIRSCFNKPVIAVSTANFTQKDCFEAKPSAQFIPCDATKPVTLLGYTPPATTA